jgi:predicted nucleic acid-binding protein
VSGLVLDAGALLAIERGDRRMTALLIHARAAGDAIAVPAGALAQVWRGRRRQVKLARFLASDDVEIEPLDAEVAFAAGQLCALRRTSDVIDASVVRAAWEREATVVTSDPDHIARLDPSLRVIRV